MPRMWAKIEATNNRIDDFYQNHFITVAVHQTGGLLPNMFMQYRPNQEGDGLGSFFAGLARMLMPALKSGGKALAKHGLATASNIAGDLLRGEQFKTSFGNRFSETGDRIVGQMQNKVSKMMTGSGHRHWCIGPKKTNKRSRAARKLFSSSSQAIRSGRVTKKRKQTPKRRRRKPARKTASTKRRRKPAKQTRKRKRAAPKRRKRAAPAKRRRRRSPQTGGGDSDQEGGGNFDFWL